MWEYNPEKPIVKSLTCTLCGETWNDLDNPEKPWETHGRMPIKYPDLLPGSVYFVDRGKEINFEKTNNLSGVVIRKKRELTQKDHRRIYYGFPFYYYPQNTFEDKVVFDNPEALHFDKLIELTDSQFEVVKAELLCPKKSFYSDSTIQKVFMNGLKYNPLIRGILPK